MPSATGAAAKSTWYMLVYFWCKLFTAPLADVENMPAHCQSLAFLAAKSAAAISTFPHRLATPFARLLAYAFPIRIEASGFAFLRISVYRIGVIPSARPTTKALAVSVLIYKVSTAPLTLFDFWMFTCRHIAPQSKTQNAVAKWWRPTNARPAGDPWNAHLATAFCVEIVCYYGC